MGFNRVIWDVGPGTIIHKEIVLLGIMPYDNRLERSECSAITHWANIYAK
jgi:hypothetical protein